MVQSSNVLDIPVYLIYHREDRKAESVKHFEKTGVSPSYVKGFDAKKLFGDWPLPHRAGSIGCYLSFLSAFNTAYREGSEYVIIGEDDMYFVENFEEKFKSLFENLPSDWEAVFLGHYPFEDRKDIVNEHLIKHFNFHGHHAVLYKREALLKVLEHTEILLNDVFDLRVISMQNDGKLNIYVAEPQICKAKSNQLDHIFTSTTDGRSETDENYLLRKEIIQKIEWK